MKCTVACKSRVETLELALKVIRTWAKVDAERKPEVAGLLLDIVKRADAALNHNEGSKA